IQVFVRHMPLWCHSVGMWMSTTDTKILSHLVDPRGKEEGGTGHSLADLAEHYLGESKLDTPLKDRFKQLKLTPYSTGYARIPWNDPVYVRYAGVDAILTARLYTVLEPLSRPYRKLVEFEHKVAMIASLMDAQGFLLDVEYTTKLYSRLADKAAYHYDEAK